MSVPMSIGSFHTDMTRRNHTKFLVGALVSSNPSMTIDRLNHQRAGPRNLDCFRQRLHIECPVMASTVDEEGRSSRHTAQVGGLDILPNAITVDVFLQVVMKLLFVEPEI